MQSYRKQLAKIGIDTGTASYRSFSSRPPSLRQAMRAMDFPAGWAEQNDIYLNETWTENCQGVAFDGAHWIFSSNGSQGGGDNPKGLYVFNAGTPLHDDNVVHQIVLESPHADVHIGQITFFGGRLFVSRYPDGPPGQVVVLHDQGGGSFVVDTIIELEGVKSPISKETFDLTEFQAINPWDGNLYSCSNDGGDGLVHEFFIHDPSNGAWTGRTLPLRVPLLNDVQGACFSPDGHLYVSFSKSYHDSPNYQWIFCYSALNGALLGKIPVLAEQQSWPKKQELEGICVADVGHDGVDRTQIHAVLLENIESLAHDNVYFKSFAAVPHEVT